MTFSHTITSAPIQRVSASSASQLPPSKSCGVDYIGTKICLFLDYIPFASTITNVIAIFLKVILGRAKIAAYARKSHYFNHLQQKSMTGCLLLTIPWIGNGLWPIYKLKSTRKTPRQPVSTRIDQPVTHLARPSEIHPTDNRLQQTQHSNMQRYTPPVVENRPLPASNLDFQIILQRITPTNVLLSAQQHILSNQNYRSDVPEPPVLPTQSDETQNEKTIGLKVRDAAQFFVPVEGNVLELEAILRHAQTQRIRTLGSLGYGPDRAEKEQKVKKAYSEAIEEIFKIKKEEIRDFYERISKGYEKTIARLTGLYGPLNAYSSYNTLSDYVKEIKQEIESFLNDPNFLRPYLTVAE